MKPAAERVPSAGEIPPARKLRYEEKPRGSWRKSVGVLKDADIAPDAFRRGAEWRERMNREGR